MTGAPDRSAAVLDRAASCPRRRHRVIVINLGLVFGAWFLAKLVDGLGRSEALPRGAAARLYTEKATKTSANIPATVPATASTSSALAEDAGFSPRTIERSTARKRTVP